MANSYDFIVVGAGTAGLLLATRLATALPDHTVVVLESGSAYPDNTHLCQYDKFQVFERPDLDLGYVSTPQAFLRDREIPYFRGKGPGGSSNINFMVYLYGSGEDYNHWAELVGDDFWRWDQTQRRFKEIETFHTEVPGVLKKYAHPLTEDHGQKGPLHVSLPSHPENGITGILDAATRFGMPLNLDVNSGCPIGISIAPSSSFKGYRSTSESIYTCRRPGNLTMVTDAKVAKITFENKVAVGVETIDGRTFVANQEVILSAGCFDTPKILLLSGIGPKEELSQHNIQVIHDLPGVGKNLSDHVLVCLGASYAQGFGLLDRWKFDSDPDARRAAREQWKQDGTGVINLHRSCMITGWLKEEAILKTDEYQSLGTLSKQHLAHGSVPHYEIIFGGPQIPPTYVIPEGTSFLCAGVGLMNMQSRGEVTLKSANPNNNPIINPNYMSHPYDRRMLSLAVREIMKFFESGAIEPEFNGYVLAPKSQSDEDIYEFIEEQLLPIFHANGTVKMGKADDSAACTDPNFRVYGVEKLRVVDLSICPMTPNNHLQATAYLVAQAAFEKMIAEYSGVSLPRDGGGHSIPA
ncbi:hypothetical protein PABG_12443 [Paracoccidioides brasiliensis Pb03]|nr:hypothetical protein PABG_12443 [Paracoccidioides brasiliensis Pb03]